MDNLVKNLRKSFASNETKSLKWRKDQLLAVQRLVNENKQELCSALKQDLNKPDHETTVMEFGIIENSITYMLKNLSSFMELQKVNPIVQARAIYTTYIQYQPLGVVLVIGAWNYPYQLLLVPLIGALASGNCVVVKPSELAPKSSQLLEKLWPKYFDSNFVALVEKNAFCLNYYILLIFMIDF